MKKILTITLMVMLSLPIFAQIPNWSFENWDSTYVVAPQSWDMVMGKVTPVTPSNGGNWACKIENDSIMGSPGVVMDGKTNDGQSFWGGKKYSQKPDSIKVYVKYNIAPLDTARLLVLFKNTGHTIGGQLIALATGSHTSSFQKLVFKINTLVQTPDTVILGFVSSDYKNHPNGPWPASNYLIVDDVSFIKSGIGPVPQQVPNNGFELWDSTQVLNPQGWYNTNDPRYLSMGLPLPLERSTNFTDGKYSLLMKNFITPTDTIRGGTFTPSPGKNPWDYLPSFKLTPSFTDNTFSLDYKYLPQNGDSLTIMLGLFEDGQSVGGCFFRDKATVSTWTSLYLPIMLGFGSQPDSAKIYFWAYKSDQNYPPQGNSQLYVDNLAFGFNTNIKEQKEANHQFSIYPNPIKDASTISFQLSKDENVSVKIYDVSGKEVAVILNKSMSAGDHSVNIDAKAYANGIYFCHLTVGKITQFQKMVIEK